MEITNVQVKLIPGDKNLKAVARVDFDNVLSVHGIRLVRVGVDGRLQIYMPDRKMPDGQFKDVIHTIDPGFRENLRKAVVQAYMKSLSTETAEA